MPSNFIVLKNKRTCIYKIHKFKLKIVQNIPTYRHEHTHRQKDRQTETVRQRYAHKETQTYAYTLRSW